MSESVPRGNRPAPISEWVRIPVGDGNWVRFDPLTDDQHRYESGNLHPFHPGMQVIHS